MDWVQLIGAVGVGAVLTKILDIAWLQHAIREGEKRRWFREQRLRVYSQLTKECLSMGTASKSREDAFLGYSLASEAMLLVDNEELANEIEHFFTMLANLFSEGCKADDDSSKRSEEELEEAYRFVVEESRRLTIALRKSLHEKK